MLALFADQTLFAQRGGGAGANGPQPELFGGFMAIFLGVMCVIILVSLAIQIFFCLTLSKALQRVRPDLRTLEPGQVWLLLIPFFNLYWVFVVTSKVPESLGREFRERGLHRRGQDYGAAVGKWYAICTIVSIIPFVNYIAGPAALICWILFWVKVAGASKELAAEGDYDGGDYDDEDDRPGKKSRRDEDEEDEEDEDDRGRRRRDWS